MANAVDLRRGVAIMYQGAIHVVTEYQHVTPGNWRAYVQVTIRNIKNGNSFQARFRSTENVEVVTLESHTLQYLYRDSHGFNFMNSEDFSNVTLSPAVVGDTAKFLKEGEEIEGLFHGAEPIELSLPASVVLKVVTTPPGFKGDSVTNLQKPATLENGLEINVPLFIKEGDLVRVDTRTGAYMGREQARD
ncbi:MAG: elongation factor P [Candidatus Aureabacteria bacterium]|nr:elongation factor P [Candidatus Auribacterota bacterium]